MARLPSLPTPSLTTAGVRTATLATLGVAAFGWLVAMAGTSAVQAVCYAGGSGGCRSTTGLNWWAIWWQAFTLAATGGAVLAMGLRSLRGPATMSLGLLALLSMLLAERALTQGEQTRRALYSADNGSRWSATACGFVLTAMCNLALITLLPLGKEAALEELRAAKLPDMPALPKVALPKLPKKGGAAAGGAAAPAAAAV